MIGLVVVFGCVVGFVLGFMGGGGGVFVVLLLIGGLGIVFWEVIGILFVLVGGIVLIGVVLKFVCKEVDFKMGLIIVIVGMCGVLFGNFVFWMIFDMLLM